ncbi:hypothetical protein PGB90_008887 [Kerria lacca]
MLKEINVKYKDRRVIWNLYKEQKAEIKVEDRTEEARIRKGVRQGCSLSSISFNLFIEKVIEEMNETGSGVSMQGQKVRTIRFADDIAILEENEKELEKTLEEI